MCCLSGGWARPWRYLGLYFGGSFHIGKIVSSAISFIFKHKEYSVYLILRCTSPASYSLERFWLGMYLLVLFVCTLWCYFLSLWTTSVKLMLRCSVDSTLELKNMYLFIHTLCDTWYRAVTSQQTTRERGDRWDYFMSGKCLWISGWSISYSLGYTEWSQTA